MRRLNKKYIRFLTGLGLGLALAALVAFNTLLVWVATGPRSLSAFTPFIEDALRSRDGSYAIDIDETWLIWDGWRHPIDVRLRGVTILTADGQVFSSFPEISLGLDVPALLKGRIRPRSLSIDRPDLSLLQNDDGSISFGFQSPGVAADQSSAPEKPTHTIPFAAVLMPLLEPEDDSPLGRLRFVAIHNAEVSVSGRGTGVLLQAGGANFYARRSRAGEVQLTADADFTYGEYQSNIEAQFSFRPQEPAINAHVKFKGVEPSQLAALFPAIPELAVAKLPFSGEVSLTVDREGTMQRALFTLEGGMGTLESARLAGPLPVHWVQVEGQASNDFSDIQVDSLRANIDGMILAADGVASLSGGDIAARANLSLEKVPAEKVALLWPPELAPLSREWVTENIKEGVVPKASARVNIQFGDLARPALPKEAVDASIELEGAKIRYLPEHPPVTNVRGSIHIDGVALEAKIASADYMKDTKLTNGRVLIEDLNADNPYIKVDFSAETSASDVVRLLGLPRLGHAKRLGLKESIEGTAKGTASLGFNFFAPPGGEADITYSVKAEVKGIAQTGFMEQFDISRAEGGLTVNNRVIEYKGRGDINGSGVARTEIVYRFASDDFSPFVFGETNLTRLSYQPIDDGWSLEVKGRSADLSAWLEKRKVSEEGFSFVHFPAVQLKADLGRLILGEGRMISDFQGGLTCTARLCAAADISGKTGNDQFFNFRILRNPAGRRQLSLRAEDAGAFLKAFGIYEEMRGGALTMTGNYDDNTAEGLLKGRLDIRDFALKNAPILAQILSLASPTGFFNTLQGKGIQFKRLSVPFILHNDEITVAKARAYGEALGITVDGTIAMPKTALNLEGTVAPAYALNTLAGKVPLFGQMLTGGEGQGMFAARYSVSGTEKDPKVTVNPLSILTPGFLRGLFDVFERPEEEPEE